MPHRALGHEEAAGSRAASCAAEAALAAAENRSSPSSKLSSVAAPLVTCAVRGPRGEPPVPDPALRGQERMVCESVLRCDWRRMSCRGKAYARSRCFRSATVVLDMLAAVYDTPADKVGDKMHLLQ